MCGSDLAFLAGVSPQHLGFSSGLAEDEILAVWFTVHLRDTEQKSWSTFCSRKPEVQGCVPMHSVNGQTPRGNRFMWTEMQCKMSEMSS